MIKDQVALIVKAPIDVVYKKKKKQLGDPKDILKNTANKDSIEFDQKVSIPQPVVNVTVQPVEEVKQQNIEVPK